MTENPKREPTERELEDQKLEEAWRAAKGALAAIEELRRRRRAETQGRIERESANPDQGIAAS